MQCSAGPAQTGLLGRRILAGANLGACSPLKQCYTKLGVEGSHNCWIGLSRRWGGEGGCGGFSRLPTYLDTLSTSVFEAGS